MKLAKAGVSPERAALASPQQNGRLERLHLYRCKTRRRRRRRLSQLGRPLARLSPIYNEERPHEALGLLTPASVYTASPRRWSGRLRSPEYDAGVAVRRVRSTGLIKWRGGLVYVSAVLAGEPVGIVETEDSRFELRYGPVRARRRDAGHDVA